MSRLLGGLLADLHHHTLTGDLVGCKAPNRPSRQMSSTVLAFFASLR
jgi:hypothetical protein